MKQALLLLAVAGTILAQPAYKAEVYGNIGGGSIWDDEGSLGSGIAFGGVFGWRPSPRIGVEVNVDRFRHDRDFGFATVRGNGVFLTGDILYHFSRSRVQPYLLAGAGLVHYNNESGFAPGAERSATGPAANFAFGVKGFVTERISIRPEWRIGFGSGISEAIEPPLLYQRISVGIGYRW